MNEIGIRPLASLSEMAEVEELQKTIWDIPDIEIVPVHALHAIQFNGGALYGAYDDGRLVGFALGMLGAISSPERIDQIAAARLKMYSVMAGVLPEYQDKGVGYRLKLAQREFALRVGLRLITWTYDPLESRNGRFNISKLGCVCQSYLRNFHGEMAGINAGLPTDRFEVEWWITSNRVEGRVVKERRPLSLDSLLSGGAAIINPAAWNENGLPIPPDSANSPKLLNLLEIPADFQAIKKTDPGLAQAWRQHTRELFESMFQQNYLVTDFVFDKGVNGRARSFYLLASKNS
ncbi:MAG: hypothetical protein ACE5FD_17075 [Anaerolineae bacterium]